MARRIWIFLFILGLVQAAHAKGPADDLYLGQAVVTGKGEKNRLPGFRNCFERAILRVSGDQRLLRKPEFAGLKDRAGEHIASFSYRDRLEGIPIHDEQGSYDRPHDLTCMFDKAKLDGAIAQLGGKPWLTARPVVVPLLAVQRGDKRFVLSADGGDGPFMDVSFAAAAGPLAMRMVLPSKTDITQHGIDAGNLWAASGQILADIARSAGGAVPLLGRLVWSDADLGWVADWRIAVDGRSYDWQIRGVSFDEAFRVAMRGAAQVLSGNGQP